MADLHTIRITVNDVVHEAVVESRLSLADALRHVFGLTGTHLGCEHGVCGACTVLLDGATARGCLTLAVQAHDHAVTTIEGIATADGMLHPLQVALAAYHGLQCGFCTPGVVMTLIELQRELEGRPITESAVRRALAGHLCRCTGYQGMINAALYVLNTCQEDTVDRRSS